VRWIHPVQDHDAQVGPKAVGEIDREDGHGLTLPRGTIEDKAGSGQIRWRWPRLKQSAEMGNRDWMLRVLGVPHGRQ
jgi:hypothetical protein